MLRKRVYMAVIPNGNCGVCHRPLSQRISDDSQAGIVKTQCGHTAHGQCFFNNDQIQKITKVKARIFCFDEECQNHQAPNSIFYGNKKTWRDEIVQKGKIELIPVPEETVETPREVAKERESDLKRRELKPVIFTFGLSLVSITAICAFAAFQTITATMLAIAAGALVVHLSRRTVENYLLASN